MISFVREPEQILRSYFGYDAFRGPQRKVVDALLRGKDVFVLMPTGGGKSLCFQVPGLMLQGVCLVISPLIALMKDQVEALRLNGIDAAYLNSSLPAEEEFLLFQKMKNSSIRFLYISPERALHLPPNVWSEMRVSLIAVDEAHCVSQWGHDFRPEYARIGELRKKVPDAPMIALTASADKLTRKDILDKMGLRNPEIFISSFDRPNLSLAVKSGLKTGEKNKQLLQFLSSRRNESGIIYCSSRKLTEEVSAMLREKGIRNAFYHAGMESAERARVQDAFLHDEILVICATIAFGMGIDKSNVRWVVHYNLPKNMESYYQEIGRAGRDALPADTLLLYEMRDVSMLGYFAAQSNQPELQLEKLQRMQQFAEAGVCRRKLLLAYFGEMFGQNCGNCDVCLNPPNYSDQTESVLKILKIIEKGKEMLSSGLVLHILRGSMAEDVRSGGFHLLPVFASGKNRKEEVWQQIILQLTGTGVLEIAYDEKNALKFSAEALAILHEGKRIFLAQIPEVNQEEQVIRNDTMQYASPAEPVSDLFEKLRALRLEIAREEKVPPYIVFHDKTLRELVERKPISVAEFVQVHGISERKCEKYGDRFLRLISACI